jgi:hypothetical protein
MRADSSDSETDVDFDQACSDLSVSCHDVNTDIWWEIERDAVQETTNSMSTSIKFCISVSSVMTRDVIKELYLMR